MVDACMCGGDCGFGALITVVVGAGGGVVHAGAADEGALALFEAKVG